MKTLKITTIGTGPNYPENFVELSVKNIADAIQEEISGKPSTEMRASQLTQDFVDRFEIKARYSSGTLLGFKVSDEAIDEFLTFKKW